MRKALFIAAGLLVAGCQYKAEPVAVGAFNVYSSYSEKLPGKYLLLIEVASLDQTVRPTGLECSAHSYPLALSASFKSAAVQTLGNLVESVELVDAPVGGGELASHGARGMIIIRGEQLISRLRAVPGLWTSTIESDVEIVASVIVDGKSGRLMGSTISGSGRAEQNAGGACEGGAGSLGEAATGAMRQSLTKIGEAISNSERVRRGV